MSASTLFAQPTITLQPTNQIVLNGSNVVFSLAVSGTGPFTYQWQFNGTNLPPIITTVAGTNGSGFAGDGGPATSAKLNFPEGVAVDASGNLFIADYSNNRIRKVDTNGVITTVVGTGTQGNGGNGGAATSANLYRPEGVIFDSSGNLYISENGNGDLRKMDTNGIITRAAGTGSENVSPDGGQATNTSFYTLTCAALDGNGNLYLNESFHCHIRKVATNGIVTTVAGNTSFITGGFSGDGGLATNAQLSSPEGVALDAFGNVYIADYNNSRIRQVNTNGIINTVVGGGSSSNDGLLGTNTSISFPTAVGVDRYNVLYFSDSGRVRKMNTNGIVTTVAGGSFNNNNLGDYGPATSAYLSGPTGITFDALGNMYLADPNNYRVRKVHFAGDPTLLLLHANTNQTGSYSVMVTSPFGSVNSSNFNLTVINLPMVASTLVNPDGTVTLIASTTTNVSSRVYAATNLMPPIVWQPVYTNSLGGVWQFTDTNASNQPVQFYRVSTP